MNIKALIKKYEAVECLVSIVSGKTILKTVLRDLKQLDEPEKVKVPQCVADWIEYCKARKITLAHALYHSEEAKNKSVYRWLFEESGSQEKFARAWLTDYEAEKEPKYKVKLKNTDDYLNQTETGFHFFNNGKNNEKFTRKELEYSGFGEVFNSPLFEVEEVER